jgi:membrane protein YqaA with SNARE-associated domain
MAVMDWMAILNGAPALWGLFISAFVSSTVAPGGSEAVLAYLVSQGGHEPGLLIGIATAGNTLGALTTWLLGYWVGQRFPADRPLESQRHRAVLAVRRWGLPLLLLSWLPVVGDGFCFAAGWLKLSFWPSLLAIALGKLGRYAAIGYALLA